MRIAIVDADLIGRKRHRFPNLASMKLSAFYKKQGHDVSLKTDYEGLDGFDLVFVSKVFTDTPIPESVLEMPNVRYGGTGFYYDKAPKLPEEVEHQMPDYHLYDAWIEEQIANGVKAVEFSHYRDYSIGFLTRGCFRKCSFCVNRNYDRVALHSPLNEFLDKERPKVCLLDDNFFGCPEWKRLLTELQATGKPFHFKQGLDERLLTDEKCELLFRSHYVGDFIFAFDNIADAPLIEQKLQLIRRHTNTIPKFYCFCGFDRNDKWDDAFWEKDIFDLFSRIELLMRYGCLPYIMRYARYEESPYRGIYITLARWCNQPGLFKKKTLREFSRIHKETSACVRYLKSFEEQFPEVGRFYDMRFGGNQNEKTDPR